MEFDLQVLVTRLSKMAIYSSNIDSVLEDVLAISSNFTSVIWSRVRRDRNVVSHHLVKLFPFGVEQVWENHCPMEISDYVLSDSSGLII